MKMLSILLFPFFVFAGASYAADSEQEQVATQSEAAMPADEMGLLKGRLWKVFNRQPDSMADSPMDGFYEAVYGSKIFYVSMDGKHLFNGDLFDLNTLDNLTEQRRSVDRLKVIDMIPESSMIVYKAKDEKHVMNVFTDIDCGYCRKLHKDMQQLNDLGITVRYLAYPRAGLNSPSYDKAVSVWCAKDRNKAMDAAKAGNKIESVKCDAPVKEHMVLGQQLGVSGTPALVLEDGRLQPGYAPPKQLLSLFD